MFSTYIHTHIQTLQTHVKNPTQTRESYQFPPPFPSQQLYRSNLPNLHICIPLSLHSPHHKTQTQTHISTTTTPTSHPFRIPESQNSIPFHFHFHNLSSYPKAFQSPTARPISWNRPTASRRRTALWDKKRVCQLLYSRYRKDTPRFPFGKEERGSGLNRKKNNNKKRGMKSQRREREREERRKPKLTNRHPGPILLFLAHGQEIRQLAPQFAPGRDAERDRFPLRLVTVLRLQHHDVLVWTFEADLFGMGM